jgi:hypothetical protein
MKVTTSVPCPFCTRSISVWRVMTAPTPLHLKCPSCYRPLRARNLTLPLVVAGIAVGVILGQRLLEQARAEGGLPLRGLLVSVLIVIAFDFVASFAVVNVGKLSQRD